MILIVHCLKLKFQCKLPLKALGDRWTSGGAEKGRDLQKKIGKDKHPQFTADRNGISKSIYGCGKKEPYISSQTNRFSHWKTTGPKENPRIWPNPVKKWKELQRITITHVNYTLDAILHRICYSKGGSCYTSFQKVWLSKKGLWNKEATAGQTTSVAQWSSWTYRQSMARGFDFSNQEISSTSVAWNFVILFFQTKIGDEILLKSNLKFPEIVF